MRFRLLACSALGVLALTAPVRAEIRALVIGIDDYVHINRLKGATSDAKDIAAQLGKMGVKDVNIVLDREATRDNIMAKLKGLLGRSRRGDLLMWSYAGHGTQEKERFPGNEADGKDEVFLLAGFQEKGPGTRERIIDDEINDWLVKFGQKEVKVLFIADSCHSGSMTRNVDPRVELTTRIGPTYTITEDMLTLEETPPSPDVKHPHVTFLSGGQDNEQIPEVRINGTPRGALSYAIARALEGQADSDADGVLTRGELYHYVRKTTRELAESRQTPNFEPQSGLDEPVLTRGAPTGKSEPPPPVRALTIRIKGQASAASALAQLVAAGTVAIVDKDSDLLWDVAAGQVISGNGDVIAYKVDKDLVRNVVERTLAVERLLAMPKRAGAQTSVRPDDKLHEDGKDIGFTVTGVNNRYLILTSISGDGTVHWLGTKDGQPNRAGDSPFKADFTVTPPHGADLIVAFVSEAREKELENKLRALDGSHGVKDLLKIAEELDRKRVEILLQGIYTAPRKS